jgi:hypothetical protein
VFRHLPREQLCSLNRWSACIWLCYVVRLVQHTTLAVSGSSSLQTHINSFLEPLLVHMGCTVAVQLGFIYWYTLPKTSSAHTCC